MEGVDMERLAELVKHELDDHVCDIALAMGYHKDGEDYITVI
jgi:nitroreductase/dihydropteridine reductase